MPKKHQARCACGAVRFEFDTDPTFIALCHCLDCKKASGGDAEVPAAMTSVGSTRVHRSSSPRTTDTRQTTSATRRQTTGACLRITGAAREAVAHRHRMTPFNPEATATN